ncbi:ferredoxin family protein [Pigmentiphaga daeguensis]|uniref:4Fe-4S ferredoxin-type domain-containing protein n=1 Tax=Pigmentiphaga daeguensis TaxID=414049 RepID=A0ABN1CFR8_9BURK
MTDTNVRPVTLDASVCTDCRRCLDACPTGVFQPDPESGRVRVVYPDDCHVCFLCVPDCPAGAIAVSWDAPNPRLRSIYDTLDIVLAEPARHERRLADDEN